MKQCNRHNKYFTLLEVVVALAILATAVMSYMMLSSQAVRTASMGLDIWAEAHRMSQAAEYALTVGPDQMGGIPNQFFPFTGYSVSMYQENPVDLPTTQKLDEMGDLPRRLKTITIRIRNNYTNQESRLSVDAIVYTGEGVGQ